MPQDPNAQFDQTVLDMIEHSPIGAVPRTTHHQDALKRLYATHQVYADADHPDGHVTARSLARLPHFHAGNLEALIAGQIDAHVLEGNQKIFDRYVQSLAAARREKAESFRVMVAGRPPMHRAKVVGDTRVVAHDPLHSLFMVPGVGPQHGLPGNYLYGYVFQGHADAAGAPTWAVHLHDSDHDAAVFDAPTLKEALLKVQEVMESAPFNLTELDALGFRLK